MLRPAVAAALPTALFRAMVLAPRAAHAQTGLGVGVRVADARGAFASDVENRGYGVVGTSVVTGSDVWLSMTTAWTRFRGAVPEVEEGEEPAERLEEVDIYEVMLGWGISLGAFRAGIRGGRFFGDGRSWGYMPVVGVGLGPLLVTAEWDPRGPVKWFGVTGSLVR